MAPLPFGDLDGWPGTYWLEEVRQYPVSTAAPVIPDRAPFDDAVRAATEALRAAAVKGDKTLAVAELAIAVSRRHSAIERPVALCRAARWCATAT